MSPEPTDAEWLRDIIEYCENVAGFPQSLSMFSVDNEVVRRFKSIAARLERPAVELDGFYADCGGYGAAMNFDFERLTELLGREPTEGERFKISTTNPAAAAGG